MPLLFLVALNVSRSVCCGDGGVGGGDEVDNVRSRQLPRTAPVVLVHGRVSASNEYRSQFPLSLLSHLSRCYLGLGEPKFRGLRILSCRRIPASATPNSLPAPSFSLGRIWRGGDQECAQEARCTVPPIQSWLRANALRGKHDRYRTSFFCRFAHSLPL